MLEKRTASVLFRRPAPGTEIEGPSHDSNEEADRLRDRAVSAPGAKPGPGAVQRPLPGVRGSPASPDGQQDSQSVGAGGAAGRPPRREGRIQSGTASRGYLHGADHQRHGRTDRDHGVLRRRPPDLRARTVVPGRNQLAEEDRKSTRLNSS